MVGISDASTIPVQDRLDIMDMLARQSQAVDRSDGDAWAATFTVDGVFHSPTYQLTARGTTELKAFAENSNDAAKARGEQFRHVVSAIALTPSDEGFVDCVSYLTILATTAEGSRVDRSLVMADRLQKTDAGWQVLSREVFRD